MSSDGDDKREHGSMKGLAAFKAQVYRNTAVTKKGIMLFVHFPKETLLCLQESQIGDYRRLLEIRAGYWKFIAGYWGLEQVIRSLLGIRAGYWGLEQVIGSLLGIRADYWGLEQVIRSKRPANVLVVIIMCGKICFVHKIFVV